LKEREKGRDPLGRQLLSYVVTEKGRPYSSRRSLTRGAKKGRRWRAVDRPLRKKANYSTTEGRRIPPTPRRSVSHLSFDAGRMPSPCGERKGGAPAREGQGRIHVHTKRESVFPNEEESILLQAEAFSGATAVQRSPVEGGEQSPPSSPLFQGELRGEEVSAVGRGRET